MESIKGKLLLVGILSLLMLAIVTCNYQCKQVAKSVSELQDTTIFNSLKKVHLKIEKKYNEQLVQLNITKGSLGKEVEKNKRMLSAYQIKARNMKEQLRDAISKADSNVVSQDTLSKLSEAYFNVQYQSDSLCLETIENLQSVIENRDSSIVIHEQVEDNLRDLQKEQELRTQYLTEQINTFHKQLKRKSRQNKILKGGIFLLTGIATSLIIIQAAK